MVEVVRRRVGVLGQDAQDAVVVEGAVAVDVDPVRGTRERHHRVGVRLLDRLVANLQHLGELFVRAQPRVAATSARVARLEFRLVPDDPLVDLAGVVLDGLVRVLAEVVVGIVERQVQVLGNRALAVVGVGGRPARRELEQTRHFGAAVQLSLDLVLRQRLAELAEVAGLIWLDLIPGKDQTLPARADIGHHRRISKPFGNTETGIGDGVRVGGHHRGGDDRQGKQTAHELGCAHVASTIPRSRQPARCLGCQFGGSAQGARLCAPPAPIPSPWRTSRNGL